MKWNVGFKIGAGFTLALTLMAVIGTVSYRNTVQLVDTAAWVSHTHEVLESLESVLSHLRDAETGQGVSSLRVQSAIWNPIPMPTN